MWILNVIVVVALGASAFARPQRSDSFEADGFVFDGPADRPPFKPQPSSSPRTTPTTQGTPVTNAPTTQGSSRNSQTTTSVPTAQFDACLASCLVTPEYNPVCGTDLVLYSNPGTLNCATACGKDVSLKYYGPCSTSSVRG